MDKEWSILNKEMQDDLKKKATFSKGIEELLKLRNDVFTQIKQIVHNYPNSAFSIRAFNNVNGYHGVTLAYSMWHIFRIEDIVLHTLILKDEQIFFKNDYQKRINSSITTTGNELDDEETEELTKDFNIKELYAYTKEVKESTDNYLKTLSFDDLKKTFNEEDKQRLLDSNSVSTSEYAIGLIDYWCSKDIKGLIQMPFSRHWIMHVEAMRRIKNKLCEKAKKGVDPVCYCGLSCNHCFLKEYCGACRTEYNTCSYATIFEDKKCPNMVCCLEKGIDGCYECDELENCNKGFYQSSKNNVVKANAIFIKKYGKKTFLKTYDNLHKRYKFQKIQEITGESIEKALSIFEENKD